MTYQEKANTCFQLLQTIVSNAYGTETYYFTPPYENLSKIDQGLRDILLPGFSTFDTRFVPSKSNPHKRFFVVKSNLGFYNIIVYLNLEKSPDFFSIGPFRGEEFSNEYFLNVAKDLHLPSTTTAILQKYYDELPFLSLSSLTLVVKEVLATFFPEFSEIEALHIEYKNKKEIVQINTDALSDLTADYAEEYKNSLFRFLEALTKGNQESASAALHDFLIASRFFYIQNIEIVRRDLHALNSYCRAALFGTTVHPSYVLQLSVTLSEKIDTVTNRQSLHRLASDICHKYCLLIKNYAFHEYSKSVRAVINYIHLHLDEDLTLSYLAKLFDKNASSLSSAFSKEVGMSITNYVHQARIKEAILYFNTTKMSISEVSVAVGFKDFAYFSRLFHKQIGCSPRDYCKSIHQNQY